MVSGTELGYGSIFPIIQNGAWHFICDTLFDFALVLGDSVVVFFHFSADG